MKETGAYVGILFKFVKRNGAKTGYTGWMFANYELFLAFTVFAFVSSITPGPNNVMLLTSGVNFGFRRSIPHMLGVTIGFSVMLAIVGMGLGQVFEKYPIFYTILRYISAIYLLYLAWQIAKSGPVTENASTKKPMTFFQAAVFQWVNPKAWVMGVVAITTYASHQNFSLSVLVIAIAFIAFVLPSGCLWLVFGNWFRRYLNQPLHLRIFNITMAVLLVLSLYPLLLD